jgi:GT2 family glycosyltransferase
MHRNQLVGLEDFWPMRWVLTRFMIFHVSLWERVHGFQESRQHGGDTDFAIRCEKTGAKVLRLPRNVLPHYDVDTGEAMSTSSHIEWIAYLLRRHPTKIAPKLPLLIGSKLGLTSQSDMYPKEWNGLSYDMSPPINGSNADSK